MSKVSIPKTEYLRLKKLDKRFAEFLKYFEHAKDISIARREIKNRKTISQEQLFRKLGI